MHEELLRVRMERESDDQEWEAAYYTSTEEEDEDWFYEEPKFSIKGSNCKCCGQYIAAFHNSMDNYQKFLVFAGWDHPQAAPYVKNLNFYVRPDHLVCKCKN
jgi:hypothetical protein